MKCAEISPVYKNTDNVKKNNYRPVSVLTAISKTYETVWNDQIIFVLYLMICCQLLRNFTVARLYFYDLSKI